MSFTEHRQRLYETIPVNSLIVSYAGIPLHANEDDYCAFEVNSQYFWLTGIEREGTAFIAFKSEEKVFETLFIEEPDEFSERWTGKMPTKDEVREISGIENVQYVDAVTKTIRIDDTVILFEDLYGITLSSPLP